MDSEAYATIERLNQVLDELDTLYTQSFSTLEDRISEVRSVMEQMPLPDIPTDNNAPTSNTLEALIAPYKCRIEALEHLAREQAASPAVGEAPFHPNETDLRLQIEIEALRMDKAHLSEEVQRLTREHRAEELAELDRQLEERDREIASLHSEREELREQLAEQAEQTRTQQQMLHDKNLEAEGISAQLAAAQERGRELEQVLTECEALKAQASALEQQLEEQAAAYNNLQDQAQQAASDTDALQGQLKERTDQCAALQTELASAVEMRANMELAMNAARTECAEQTEKLAEQEQSLNAAREAHAAAIAVLEQQLTEATTAREALEQELTQMKAADQDRESLQLLLSDRDHHIGELEKALEQVGEEASKSELKVKMLLDQIEAMRYQQEENASLRQQISRLEQNLEEQRNAIIKLQAQLASTRDRSAETPAISSEQLIQSAAAQLNTKERVAAAAGAPVRGKRGTRKQMGEILIDAGVLTRDQLQEAMRFQAADPKRRLGSFLVENGYVSEEVIAATLAAQLRIRFVENLEQEMAMDTMNAVPLHLIKNHRCVPLCMKNGCLVLAMGNPLDLIAIDDIELASNARVEPVAATPTQIEAVIAKYYGRESVGASR